MKNMFKKIFNQKSNTKGFTLVELLLVIVIISALSGAIISVVNVNGMRAKSRDAQRKTDLAKIQTALELYYTDNRSYPVSVGGAWMNVALSSGNPLSTALVPNYIDVLPNDPSYGANIASPCTLNADASGGTDYRYSYITPNAGAPFYILAAIMENAASDDESKCSALVNWSKNSCGGGSASCGCTAGDTYSGTVDYCYGLQNPF